MSGLGCNVTRGSAALSQSLLSYLALIASRHVTERKELLLFLMRGVCRRGLPDHVLMAVEISKYTSVGKLHFTLPVAVGAFYWLSAASLHWT